MGLILNWGSPFEHITSEAEKARTEYLEAKNPAKKRILLRKFYDIADNRRFCVVINNNELRTVRHIIRVADNARDNLKAFKEEYYETYAQLPGDEFYFFIGLQKAYDFNDFIQNAKPSKEAVLWQICNFCASICDRPDVFPCTTIADAIGAPVYKVRQWMKELESEGYVVKAYEGGYSDWTGFIFCIHGYSLTSKGAETDYYKNRYAADVAYWNKSLRKENDENV